MSVVGQNHTHSIPSCFGVLAVLLLGLGRAAADGIKVAGDILLYALPATTAAITLGSGDWDGTLQFAEAFAIQGLTVITLKNTIYETPPNGDGHQSFPSGHAAVTFALQNSCGSAMAGHTTRSAPRCRVREGAGA